MNHNSKFSEEQMIEQIINQQFHSIPIKVERMTMGICNEVYRVKLNDGNYIIRLNKNVSPIEGTDKYIPLFKSRGIKVPEIILSNYTYDLVPYAYQILSEIEGQDLDKVISELDDNQLKSVAKEISSIFQKIRSLPTDGSFGSIDSSGHGKFTSWTAVVDNIANLAVERGNKTNVIDDEIKQILKYVIENNREYFDKVKSKFYYDDICGKNVMIDNGKFSGLVDLDEVGYGDYLEAIGRIKTSWYGTHYGDIYTNAIECEEHLSQEDRLVVTAYALIHRISWLCENGIQFNQNTSMSVNWDKVKKDKQDILSLYKEYRSSTRE